MATTSNGASQAAVTKIIVLISGEGTNLQALIDSSSTPSLPSTKIVRVISNRKAANGLKRAERAGIPTAYHNLVPYKNRIKESGGDEAQARTEYDRDLAALVLEDQPDLVVCAGWMHILAPTFLAPLQEKDVPVINLHPALPGQFNGTHAIERAWEAFQKGEAKGTGVMVHYVIDEVDMGEPILVREVEIKKGEDVSALEKKIHEVEWGIIVDGTRSAIEALRTRKSAKS